MPFMFATRIFMVSVADNPQTGSLRPAEKTVSNARQLRLVAYDGLDGMNGRGPCGNAYRPSAMRPRVPIFDLQEDV